MECLRFNIANVITLEICIDSLATAFHIHRSVTELHNCSKQVQMSVFMFADQESFAYRL